MIVAPPWKLRASGYAVLFAPRATLRRDPFGPAPPSLIRFWGGVGLLLLLEYDRSTVGPYREALYIPGYATARTSLPRAAPRRGGLREGQRRGHSIAWIIVTTEDSRDGGIANWGIPKELGTIEHITSPSGNAGVIVTDAAGRRLLRVDLPGGKGGESPTRGPWLPFSSRMLPHSLLQANDSGVYVTHVEASGRFRWSRPARISSSVPQTAEIATRSVLATLRISEVRLRFPPAAGY